MVFGSYFAFLLTISLVSVARAASSCVAFDISWNLLAFGFNGKDYDAGTVDTWATGALELRPLLFVTDFPTCIFQALRRILPRLVGRKWILKQMDAVHHIHSNSPFNGPNATCYLSQVCSYHLVYS